MPSIGYNSTMDRTDRQLVHCLLQDGRASLRRIADVLEVSEQTVARRLQRLREAGAVRVQVRPDARATGQRSWFVRMQCRPDSASSLAEALAARDDVSWVSITSGGSEIICLARGAADQGGGSILRRLPRTSQVLAFTAFTVLHVHTGSGTRWLTLDDPLTPAQTAALQAGARPHPTSPPHPLHPDDAPLLAELARDGRAGVAALARATGWPQSRISTRLDALLSTGTLQVKTDLSPAQFGYHTSAYLWLTVAPSHLAATGTEASLHPETTFAAAVTGTANLLVTTTCRTDSDLYAYVTTRIGALPGVHQAEIVPVLHRLKQGGTRLHDNRLVPT